jgi:hypothetical protein
MVNLVVQLPKLVNEFVGEKRILIVRSFLFYWLQRVFNLSSPPLVDILSEVRLSVVIRNLPRIVNRLASGGYVHMELDVVLI